MIKIYLKQTVKNFIKNKNFSYITVLGFSISLSICTLSFLYVNKELSYNKFFEDSDKIYKVINKYIDHTDIESYNYCQPTDIANKLKKQIPNIQESTAFIKSGSWTECKNKQFYSSILLIDSSFFNIFNFPSLTGDLKAYTNDKNGIIISKKFAEKYSSKFQELIGKAVKISRIENQTFTIRAILDKIPETSGINADIFINFDYHKNFGKWANVVGSTSAYIKVDDNSNINSVTKTSNKIKEELYSGTFEYYRKSGLSQKIAPFKVEFLNIKDVYLSNKFKGRIAYEKKNNLTNSYILISIALLILIISLINYIMLMLGSYTNRQKEIAIRKINGSKKKNLIVQFLIEISFSLIIAIVLSLFLTKLLTPIFNYLSNGNIFLSYLQSISLAIYYLLLYFIIISILIIPCYIITKHKPIEIFRNHNKVLNKDILAKTFIVIQFALSLILIISGFFIIKQVNHMKNRDVGFNPDNIIVLSLPYHYHLDKISLFQKLLNESPNIKTVARSDRDFVSGNSSYAVRNENLKKLNARNINIDSKYIDCLELDLIAGRNYTEQDLQNNNKVIIINQSFAKELGYKNPVGKYIYLGDSGNDKLQIIGVIKDFHIDSMKKNIEPLMLSSRSNFGNKIHKLFIKYDYSNIDKVITCMEKTWNKFEPQKGFGYAILKDMLSQQYQNEEKWSKTFIYIAIIALIISSMGLLGLTFLLLNRRVNEMGIRIVNGATISNLLIKINKEFLLYITISIVVSIPFIIYLSNKWLSGFAYKISNSYSVYILGGGIIIIFVISIVSYQTWRILSQNPVKALKYE